MVGGRRVRSGDYVGIRRGGESFMAQTHSPPEVPPSNPSQDCLRPEGLYN